MALTPTIGAAGAAPQLLWSTNNYMKWLINEQFFGRRHYVWCSPVFESAASGRYVIGSGQPPSSDPASIYRAMHSAVSRRDAGDGKISGQKKMLRALAISKHASGEITDVQRDEIFAIVRRSETFDWRPYLYVIPFEPVRARVMMVPRNKRASHEPEYIIPDLDPSEFAIIEPIPCLR